MLEKFIISCALVSIISAVCYWAHVLKADKNHIKYRHYRKAINAEAARKDDLAFYYAFMNNRNNAVANYRSLYGVSIKCASNIVDEIELSYLSRKSNNQQKN